MKNQVLNIEGMTCAACVKAVERVCKRLDGVKEANVNLATEKLNVVFDEEKLSLDDIQKAIEKSGYKALIPTVVKTFTVEGMSCAACVRAVERICKRLDGVQHANVNLATEKLNISFNPEKITTIDIKQAVKKGGYNLLDSITVDVHKKKKEMEIAMLKRRLIVSIIFAVPLLIVSMGHMMGLKLPHIIHPMYNPLNFAIVQLILTIPIVITGKKFYKVGFKTLIKREPNMDSLIAVGTTAALVYGIFAIYKIAIGENIYAYRLYFESAGVILTLITLGKYLESITKGKTSEAIKKLMGLAPKTAIVIRNEKEVQIPVDEVLVGDIIVVKPGEKLSVDGIIVDGTTSIDESMLTGESIPVEKNVGSKVIGGSINKNGSIRYKATKVGEDTALSQIIKLVQDAQGSKAPIAKMADIIAGYFVPIVIVLAIVASLAWRISGESNTFALNIFISVLVIACPCALGLATPTAIMVGTGKGAEYGVLIKSGEALQALHEIDTIVFDKTGTITEGKPRVTDIISFKNYTKEQLLQLAGSAEKASEHPLGEAIVREFEKNNLSLKNIQSFNAIPGQGIRVYIEDKEIFLGNKKLMDKNKINLEEVENICSKLAREGKTPMYIAIDGDFAGVISVADTVKDNSKKAMEKLKKMGIKVAMITGDNKITASAIGKQIGVEKVLAEVLPENKAMEVEKLQKQGKKVVMVGDGINDAPALAKANVGITIGSGTDVAMESADIVLMKSDIMDVVTAILLSRKTIRNIKENLFWAFAYNTIGIPVAMGVLYLFNGPLLNPMIGALAMSFSSVSVLLNALTLKLFKPEN